MNKIIISIFLILSISNAQAHSGRTDKNGGHKCSQASKQKGLCTGYHYHSNGSLHFDSNDSLVRAADKESAEALSEMHRTIEHSHEGNHQHKDTNPHPLKS